MVTPTKKVAPPPATKTDGKSKAIVSPTPTVEIEKSDSRMPKRGPPTTSKTKAPTLLSTKPKASTSQFKSRSLAAKKKPNFVTVGHHDEIDRYKTTPFMRKKVPSSKSSSVSSLFCYKPPIISRYCGCCGDILSIKAYGCDEKDGCDRRLHFHPEELTVQNRSKIQAAAETIKQNLLPTTESQVQSSNPMKTLPKRKKKKSKGVITIGDDLEFAKELPTWPEEALRMDETILEGLMSLKKTPINEVDCRCWKEPSRANSKGDLSVAVASNPPAKTTKKSASKAGKTLVKKKVGTKTTTTTTTNTAPGETTTTTVSTKVTITKCPKTGKKIKKTVRVVKKLVKKTKPTVNSNGVSTNINATPNKKVKPTVGSIGSAAAATATKVSSSPSTPLPMSHSISSPNNNNNNNNNNAVSAANQKSSKKKSPPSAGDKENSNDNVKGSASKKRSREKQSQGSDDDEHNHSSDDDGSDDYGENSYNGPGISAKKRRRNDEKADLELRERLMNCPLEGGPYFPSQEELMELTTIRKRNALQTFYKRFNELRQFIAIFGDENHSLGIWVNKMRMERKKWDTGSERTSLTERKIELLESIDFIWAQNHKGEIGWERRFQEIKKFKRKHGHCNVPTKSAENRALGRWVSTQRTMYKNYMKGFVGKSLTREEQERRIFLLLKEGFLFSMIPNGHEGSGGTESEGKPTEENGVVPTGTMEEVDAVALTTPMKSTVPESTVSTANQPSAELNDTVAPNVKDIAGTQPKHDATETAGDGTKTIAASAPTDVKENAATCDREKNDPIPDSKEKNVEEKKDESGNQNQNSPVKSSSSSPHLKDTVPEIKEQSAPLSPTAPVISSSAQVSVTTTPTTTPSVSAAASPIQSTPEKITNEETNETKHAEENDEDKISNSNSKEDVQANNEGPNTMLKSARNEDGKIEENDLSEVETNGLGSSGIVPSPQPKPPPQPEAPSKPKEKVEEMNTIAVAELEKEEATTAAVAITTKSTTTTTTTAQTKTTTPTTATATAATTKTETETETTPLQPASSPSNTSIEKAPCIEISESGPTASKPEAEIPKINVEPKEESPAKPKVSRNTKDTKKAVSPVPFLSCPAVLGVKETGLTTTVSLRLKDKPIARSPIHSTGEPKEGENHDTTQTSSSSTTTTATTATLETETEEPRLVTSDGLRIIVRMDDPEKAPRKRTRSNSMTRSTQKKDAGRSNPMSSLSPSRRSGRARKPSARQLEAEKSPMVRESILGR